MSQRNPPPRPETLPPEVAEALDVLAANQEYVQASGLLDPWRIDDVLENQVVPELQAIRAALGGAPAAKPTAISDLDDLPVGTVGETTEALAEGEEGDAVFDLGGTTFVTSVTMTAAVDAFDPIEVIRPANLARPIPEDEQQPERRTAPRYVTSGVDPIVVDNTTFETFAIEDANEAPIVADTVVLIFDFAIDVSFDTDADRHVIPLGPAQSPASFSAVDGIRATQVHYRQAAGAGGAASLTIIAFK